MHDEVAACGPPAAVVGRGSAVSRRALINTLGAALFAPVLYPQGTRKPLVAVHLPGRVPYFDVLTKGLVQAARGRAELRMLYANWDPHEQLRQVEASMLSKADVIAVCASDNIALEVVPALMMQRDRPMALIAFTNAIGRARDGSGAGITGYVGRDEYESGQLLGAFAERVVGASAARVLMVEGAPGTTPQRLRSEGFADVARRFPRWKITHRITVNGWRADLAELQLRRVNPERFDIVVTQWADGAVAAVRAFSAAGRASPPVVTLEYNMNLRRELLAGRVVWTTFHDVEREGREVMGLALDTLNGPVTRPFRKVQQVEVDAATAQRLEALW